MPALTIKNIPNELYNELKIVAKKHRRSLNSEIIVCLSHLLLPNKQTPEHRLSEIQNVRAQFTHHELLDNEISDAINDGRP